MMPSDLKVKEKPKTFSVGKLYIFDDIVVICTKVPFDSVRFYGTCLYYASQPDKVGEHADNWSQDLFVELDKDSQLVLFN